MSPSPSPSPWRLALELAAAALAVASSLLLLGGVVAALGVAPAGGGRVDTTQRFQLLGQQANPLIATMALTAAILAIVLRPSSGSPAASGSAIAGRIKVAGPVLMASTIVALVTVVLCLNAILLDFTSSTAAGLARVGTVIFRLGTLSLAASTLWIASAATARPKTAIIRQADIGTALTIERDDAEPTASAHQLDPEA